MFPGSVKEEEGASTPGLAQSPSSPMSAGGTTPSPSPMANTIGQSITGALKKRMSIAEKVRPVFRASEFSAGGYGNQSTAASGDRMTQMKDSKQERKTGKLTDANRAGINPGDAAMSVASLARGNQGQQGASSIRDPEAREEEYDAVASLRSNTNGRGNKSGSVPAAALVERRRSNAGATISQLSQLYWSRQLNVGVNNVVSTDARTSSSRSPSGEKSKTWSGAALGKLDATACSPSSSNIVVKPPRVTIHSVEDLREGHPRNSRGALIGLENKEMRDLDVSAAMTASKRATKPGKLVSNSEQAPLNDYMKNPLEHSRKRKPKGENEWDAYFQVNATELDADDGAKLGTIGNSRKDVVAQKLEGSNVMRASLIDQSRKKLMRGFFGVDNNDSADHDYAFRLGETELPSVENKFTPNRRVFKSRWRVRSCEDDEELSFIQRVREGVHSVVDNYKHVVVSQIGVFLWAASLHAVDGGVMILGLQPLSENYFRKTIFVRQELIALLSGIASFLLVIRINLAYSRWWDARHHVEQFAVRWFNCALVLCSFDQYTATTSVDRWLFRRRVAGLISLMHASACEELHEASQFESLALSFLDPETLLAFFGVEDQNELSDLDQLHAHDAPFRDRVSQVYAWVLMLMTGRFATGAHMIPAPILARLYVMLEDGFTSYYQAMIVRNTPFPTPFTTIIYISVTLLCFFVPLAIHVVPLGASADNINGASFGWKIVLNVCSTYGFIALAQVASTLEGPFGQDTYDHPLDSFQLDFDLALVDLLEKCVFDVPIAALPFNWEDERALKGAQSTTVPIRREDTKNDVGSGVGATAGALRTLRLKRTDEWVDDFWSDDSAIDDKIMLKPQRMRISVTHADGQADTQEDVRDDTSSVMDNTENNTPEMDNTKVCSTITSPSATHKSLPPSQGAEDEDDAGHDSFDKMFKSILGRPVQLNASIEGAGTNSSETNAPDYSPNGNSNDIGALNLPGMLASRMPADVPTQRHDSK